METIMRLLENLLQISKPFAKRCGAILLASLSLAGTAPAAPSIEGAFGIKFGQALKGVKVLRSHVNGTLYRVSPPEPMSLLRIYTVEVAGPKKLIYRITGQSLENDSAACNEDLASLMAILKTRYGEPQAGGPGTYRFSDGPRSITASCKVEGGVTARGMYKVKVTYEDSSLMGGGGL
jgi:hypothetical protein